MDRRRFLSASLLLAAGCHTDRLLSPCPWNGEFLPYVPPTPGGELRPPAREIWAVNSFSGPQLGTRDNPFQVARDGWDVFMRGVTQDPSTFGVNTPDSFFKTRACYEWGPLESPWRLPSGCYVDGHGSTLELDTNVPDSYVQSVPLHMICTTEGFTTWDAVPVGQAVRNWRFVANYSKLVDRWKALGAKLLPSAVILQGHAACIDNIELVDFGALGQEAFPLIICGVMGGPDRHALSFLDPSTFRFDSIAGLPRSHISNVRFTGYVPSLTNAQVTVTVICGMMGAQVIPSTYWDELPPYVQLFRTNQPYISNIQGDVVGSPRDNQVQLATIYQCLGGEIADVRGTNVQCLAYGDYYSTYDLHVHHLKGRGVLRGVGQFLSPVEERPLLGRIFSAEGLLITDSDIETLPIDVTYHGGIVFDPLNVDFAKAGGTVPRPFGRFTVDRCKVSSVKAVDVDGLTITENNQIGQIQIVRGTNVTTPSCRGIL